MAILGYGGTVKLKREAPEPTLLDFGGINQSNSTFLIDNPAFWGGELVTIYSPRGLPVDTETNGPDCPDGYAMYAGSIWYKGSNRSHVTGSASEFYAASDSSNFYMRAQDCGLTTTGLFYIGKDQMDRVSLYETKAAAMNGNTADRVQLYKVDCGQLIMLFGNFISCSDPIAGCQPDPADSYGSVTGPTSFEPMLITTLSGSVIVSISGSQLITYGAARPINGWTVQGLLRDWTLNLSAPEVDTTAVGEKYGDSVKSLITGGGTMDFLIDRRDLGSDVTDTTRLLQLLLVTQKGCKSRAEFWMIEGRDAEDGVLPGDLYYDTEILITSTAINTRVDDVIAGSLNFVTVGEIALRMGQL